MSSIPLVVGAGLAGGNAFVYTGTGGAAGAPTRSGGSLLSVTAGNTYCLSGYIDATQVTAGSPQWIATTSTGTTLTPAAGAVAAQQVAGQLCRVSTWFDVPAGTTQILVYADMNGATANSAGLVVFSNPQLESGQDPTEYQSNSLDDTTGFVVPVTAAVKFGTITQFYEDEETGSTTLTASTLVVIASVTIAANAVGDELVFGVTVVAQLNNFNLTTDTFVTEIIKDGSGSVGSPVSGGTTQKTFPLTPAVGGGTSSNPVLSGSFHYRIIAADLSSHTYKLCCDRASSGTGTNAVIYALLQITDQKA